MSENKQQDDGFDRVRMDGPEFEASERGKAMAETKLENKLTVDLDPRLIKRVKEYADQAGTGLPWAVTDLLEAGLKAKQQRSVGTGRGRKTGVRAAG